MGQVRNRFVGVSVVETELTSGDITISTQSPSWQATGITVTFEARTNELVLLIFSGYANASVANAAVNLAYRVNGGTTIPISSEHITDTNNNNSISVAIIPAALPAGSTTFEIMASRGGAGNWVLKETSTVGTTKLQVLRIN